jgi:glyoxylate reductase
LITWRLPSAVLARLEPVGALDIHPGGKDLSHDELCARVRGKQALIALITNRIDREVIDAGADLRVIANVAVGYNNVDVVYARERGVVVTNTPNVLTEATADLTWALILAITRRVCEGDRLVRSGEWKGWTLEFMLGTQLSGKQLGIVGMGRIGQAVAKRASAFGMNIAFTSRGLQRVDDAPGTPLRSQMSLERAIRLPLDQLLMSSDVVSIHVPLSPETRHLIDQRALVRMKRSAYLVNTSRGPVVDEAALAWALRERVISGAALDVYENEPAVHPDLLKLENVVLAPHLGSGTAETRTAMADLAASNVIAVLTGKRPLTPVDTSPGVRLS